MRQYLDLVARVMGHGEERRDRTGVGTLSLFGTSLAFDLSDGFPAVTCKRLAFGQMAGELSAFLAAADTLEEFHERGCTVWDGNAAAPAWQANPLCGGPGDLGRVYGVQWRTWRTRSGSLDQLRDAVETLRRDPWSRRAVVSAWRPDELDEMCLPPCHVMFQLSVRERAGERQLDCAVVLRSVDTFLGMPFDIASYALLAHLAAADLGISAGRLTAWFGDTHIYLNHLDQAREILRREPRPLPRLALAIPDGANPLDGFLPSWASLEGYDPHPALRADLNV